MSVTGPKTLELEQPVLSATVSRVLERELEPAVQAVRASMNWSR